MLCPQDIHRTKYSFTISGGAGQEYKIGTFQFSMIPGSPYIVMSHDSVIREEFRGKGHCKKFHKFKENKARVLGFNFMMATINIKNFPQVSSCMKNGWRIVDQFQNPETENELYLIMKNLHKEK